MNDIMSSCWGLGLPVVMNLDFIELKFGRGWPDLRVSHKKRNMKKDMGFDVSRSTDPNPCFASTAMSWNLLCHLKNGS